MRYEKSAWSLARERQARWESARQYNAQLRAVRETLDAGLRVEHIIVAGKPWLRIYRADGTYSLQPVL